MFHRNSHLILGAFVGGTLVEGFATNIAKSFFITGRVRDQGVTEAAAKQPAHDRDIHARRPDQERRRLEAVGADTVGPRPTETVVGGFRRMGL